MANEIQTSEKKLLMVDLDGTIRRPIRGEFINTPYNQEPIPKAYDRLHQYLTHRYEIVGISNQGGCTAINPETGKTYKTIDGAIDEMRVTLVQFPMLDYILFCPDIEAKNSHTVVHVTRKDGHVMTDPLQLYRKPFSGMLKLAINWFQDKHEIPPDALFYRAFVGDSVEDENAAAAGNVLFLPAEEWRNIPLRVRAGDDL
jgi:D-glycero-D-manno-heptose 1,7-bisphosphate phosphatase